MSRVGGVQSSKPDSWPRGIASGMGSGWGGSGRRRRRGILWVLITMLLVAATNKCRQQHSLV